MCQRGHFRHYASFTAITPKRRNLSLRPPTKNIEVVKRILWLAPVTLSLFLFLYSLFHAFLLLIIIIVTSGSGGKNLWCIPWPYHAFLPNTLFFFLLFSSLLYLLSGFLTHLWHLECCCPSMSGGNDFWDLRKKSFLFSPGTLLSWCKHARENARPTNYHVPTSKDNDAKQKMRRPQILIFPHNAPQITAKKGANAIAAITASPRIIVRP